MYLIIYSEFLLKPGNRVKYPPIHYFYPAIHSNRHLPGKIPDYRGIRTLAASESGGENKPKMLTSSPDLKSLYSAVFFLFAKIFYYGS